MFKHIKTSYTAGEWTVISMKSETNAEMQHCNTFSDVVNSTGTHNNRHKPKRGQKRLLNT